MKTDNCIRNNTWICLTYKWVDASIIVMIIMWEADGYEQCTEDMYDCRSGFCRNRAFYDIDLVMLHNKKMIRVHGEKYTAKIYGYVKNTSYMVNGRFPLNVKVHYFDNYGIEREVILPTSISGGADSMFPIGMTIDIYEYNGKYSYDPASVRGERLRREEELMDNKPIDPEQLHLIAVRCSNCGASYKAATGYASRCPYCGGYQNV